MFGLSITSSYIKYIGLVIVSVMVFIALYVTAVTIKDFWYSTFNIETTEQKVVRLENNEKVIKEHIKDIKTEAEIKTAVIETKVKTIVDYKDKESKVLSKLESLKHTKKKRVNHIYKMVKPKIVKHTSIVNESTNSSNLVTITQNTTKVTETIVINKKDYEQQGANDIDDMFEAYNIVKEL